MEKEEKRKERVTELVDKLDELVKSNERWKGCALPKKYKHFLINYTDSHILGKYEFFGNFDESLAQLMYEQREHHNSIENVIKHYIRSRDSVEEEAEVLEAKVPEKRCRKFIPWPIASIRPNVRLDDPIVKFFIDLNHWSTNSDDLPVYRLSYGPVISISKLYTDIYDFLTVARLQAKPIQQIEEKIKKLMTNEEKLIKIENNEQYSETT